jgi:FHA domain
MTQDVGGETVRLDRKPECEVDIEPVAFPTVSGLHARIKSTPRGFALVHLSRSNKTLLNDAPVDRSAPFRVVDRIRLDSTGPLIETLAISAEWPPTFAYARRMRKGPTTPR